MRGKKLVKVELTYWTHLTLPGDGSGSPDHSLPVGPEDIEEEEGEAGTLPVYPGRPGHLPSRPSLPTKEQILEILKEHEDEIRAKIDEIRDAVADRIPGIKEKLEAIKAQLAAKIDEIRNRPVDPGYGVEEGAPGQDLPDPWGPLKDAIKAKLDEIRQEIADRIPGVKEKIDALKARLEEIRQELIDRISGGECAQRIAAIKAAAKAKIDEIKAAVGERLPDVQAKIEAAKAALAAKIDEIKNRPIDPGFGVDAPERAPKRVRVIHR
jgi:Skp family chaperone for outer membrane proteins